jgi:integrase
MASVYEKRGTWYVQYRSSSGGRKQIATKAHSKAEAKRFAAEFERSAERQRLGLEQAPADCALTLWELCKWWLKECCPAPSLEVETSRLTRHIQKANEGQRPLGELRVTELRAAHVEEHLRRWEKEGAAPASINHLRKALRRVFSSAAKKGVYRGLNPIEDVPRRKVPRRMLRTLTAEEVPLLLARLAPYWRPFFEAALYTGLRKGELSGLLKEDVNLTDRVLFVGHSYERATTKGGHEDFIPIAEALVPTLERALRASSSEFVFPNHDGEMRTKQEKPEKILRTAMRHAGLIEGYLHVCRRCKAKGKPFEVRADDAEPRRCEQCGMRLWPRAIDRALRFHDLRHTTATLLFRAGVDAHRVQRILRHADLKTTIGTYAHLTVEDLRGPINQLPPVRTYKAALTPDKTKFTTRLLPDFDFGKTKGRPPQDFSSEDRPLPQRAILDSNQWPLAPEANALSS